MSSLLDLTNCSYMALNKSIESVLARVDNRVAYDMIEDVFELAACYACCIAVGHEFNEGNKNRI